MDIFDDPARSQNLALGLGAAGAPLIAIGVSIDSGVMQIIGAIVLAASGAVWAIRGFKEDSVAENNDGTP